MHWTLDRLLLVQTMFSNTTSQDGMERVRQKWNCNLCPKSVSTQFAATRSLLKRDPRAVIHYVNNSWQRFFMKTTLQISWRSRGQIRRHSKVFDRQKRPWEGTLPNTNCPGQTRSRHWHRHLAVSPSTLKYPQTTTLVWVHLWIIWTFWWNGFGILL